MQPAQVHSLALEADQVNSKRLAPGLHQLAMGLVPLMLLRKAHKDK